MIDINDSGIYAIYYERDPSKVYIGATTAFKARTTKHLYELKRGIHVNYKLQEQYDLCKEDPIFSLIDPCTKEEMYSKEVQWVNEFNSFKEGYNLTRGGRSGSGEDPNRAMFPREVYIKVLHSLVYTTDTAKVIASKLGIGWATVAGISAGVRHTWLKEECPHEYQLLLDTRELRKSRGISSAISSRIGKVKYPIILDPTGQEHSILNMSQFARDHGLDIQNLHSVLTGKRHMHKGWRLKI